jgi:tetratricopeptide (TPR) repeat protein
VKLFVSYTSADRGWAHWIGWQLKAAGHEAFLHEWEIGAGQNIPRWMEERIDQADNLIGVFSDKYCEAIFSRSERWAAYWDDPEGRVGFLIPVEVVEVTKWPRLVQPLNRLSLMGLTESIAVERLKSFLEPRKPPVKKPAYPGTIPVELPNTAFTQDSEPLGSKPPNFPTASQEKSEEFGTAITSLAIDPNPNIHCIDDHEPKPQIFGRDDEVETIVNALIEGNMILVAGGPGMGKTAVTTAALYDQRIVSRFGRRRVFASLETATEAHAILARLVEALGLPPTGDQISLLRILEANATEKPFAAILDNAETVFEADRDAAERFLNLVARIRGLSLAVTIRGVAPPIPGSIQIHDLPKLALEAARAAFLAVGGDLFQDDPDLPHLLEALDGHALSIRLVAAQAIGSPSLEGLRESWDEAHAEILRRSGEEEGRLTSVRASLALSLNNKRMKSTPFARRLMSLLAFLPGGLAEADVRSVLGERGTLSQTKANEAIVCLRQLQLVERRPDRRLRMLTPLRESVKSDVVPLEIDRSRLIDRYLTIATRAYSIGSRDWEKYRNDVEAEADNLDAVCELAVMTSIANRHLKEALSGLAKFHIFSGRGDVGSVERAAARLRSRPPSPFSAKCIEILADIAYARSDSQTAQARFEEALPLYRRIGGPMGEAACIKGIGNIAIGRSDEQTALARFKEALAIYQRGGAVAGKANCVASLADIERFRSNLEPARAYFEEALTLYRQVGSVLGEANCIKSLGSIARANSDLAAARAHYGEALILYRRIGDVAGEANCILELGNIAREPPDYAAARTYYEEALALFRRVGDVGGEAESLIRLGQVQLAGDIAKFSLANIEMGFACYFKKADLKDRALVGWKAMHNALTCSDVAEGRKYRDAARQSWTAIGRLDLVADWIDLE